MAEKDTNDRASSPAFLGPVSHQVWSWVSRNRGVFGGVASPNLCRKAMALDPMSIGRSVCNQCDFKSTPIRQSSKYLMQLESKQPEPIPAVDDSQVAVPTEIVKPSVSYSLSTALADLEPFSSFSSSRSSSSIWHRDTERSLEYLPEEHRQDIQQACDFAVEIISRKDAKAIKSSLEDQNRKAMQFDYISRLIHALGVVHADRDTIVAAVLYHGDDKIWMHEENLKMVAESFSNNAAVIIEDKMWLDELAASFADLDEANAEVLREYVFAALEDPRAVVLHLVDALLRLQQRETLPVYKQQIYALECLQLYAPLAHAVGLGKVMWELEDLAFRILFPQSYASIEKWHRELWDNGTLTLAAARKQLMEALICNKVLSRYVEGFTISGRTKNLFSTFKKILRDNKSKDEILDIVAMRVIIRVRKEHEEDEAIAAECCSEVYEAVVKLWSELRGRKKDYIRKPKPNGYQSIHTTVKHPNELCLEVQIRTEIMHQLAEYGDAAHNFYKGRVKSNDSVLKFANAIRMENSNFLSSGNSSPGSKSMDDASPQETNIALYAASEPVWQDEGVDEDDAEDVRSLPDLS